MILEQHGTKTFLTNSAGLTHAPGTLYLNERYRNPATKEVVARAIRVWARLADAFEIDLAARSVQAQWLTESEMKALRYLVFRPIQEIEAMSNTAIRQVASARRTPVGAVDDDPAQCGTATVCHNTAAKQLVCIANFLVWFHHSIIGPRMPTGSAIAVALRQKVESCSKSLKSAIRNTKSAHPHLVRSLPTERFLAIYHALYTRSDIYKTAGGKASATKMRDRAIALLACEGMRPGAIGNIALSDFRWDGGNNPGYIRITDNTTRRRKAMTSATPRQKGTRSHQGYNSEYLLSIWPTTADAIQEYIKTERKPLMMQGLKNRSQGFLFVAEHAGPIADRSTISYVFRRVGQGLESLGLLDRVQGDPYHEGDQYHFSAYLLRRSAASLFFAMRSQEMRAEVVQDVMKSRFGWSPTSSMPNLYAQRAMSDAAALTVDEFMDELFAAAKAKKE